MSTRDAVFDFIVQFKQAHNGIAPSVREIKTAVDLASTNTVNYHLEQLAANGRIAFPLGVRASRAIGVPGYEYTEANKDSA